MHGKVVGPAGRSVMPCPLWNLGAAFCLPVGRRGIANACLQFDIRLLADYRQAHVSLVDPKGQVWLVMMLLCLSSSQAEEALYGALETTL